LKSFKNNFYVIFLLFSCNSIKYFTTYKNPLIQNVKSYSIKSTGVYLGVNNGNAIYFYNNGLVKVYKDPEFSNSYWTNPELATKSISSFFLNNPGYIDEWWGHYEIVNDSIYIQKFRRIFHAGCFKRYIIESVGTIANDSVIQIHYNISYWPIKYQKEYKFKTVCNPSETYRFFPTNYKPDNTHAWFLDKKWYKEGLHPSRR
jgi:hypothetical protein